jgi:excisionase family DNA binding protein
MSKKLILIEPDDLERSVRKIFKEELQKSLKIKQSEKPQTKVLTLKEAAEFLKVTPTTLYIWKRDPNFPSHKINGRVLFYEDELKAYVSK